MFAEIKSETESKMEKVIEVLKRDLSGLRTGRASSNFLNSVIVEAYGDRQPIANLATITVQEGNIIMVQVWDRSVVKNIEKAINLSDLGVNASSDGQTIRVPIPVLSEERRKELVKLASKCAEQSRVAIRNIRRNGVDVIKNINGVSKDDIHGGNDEMQKITDIYIAKVDALLSDKEKDIMKV